MTLKINKYINNNTLSGSNKMRDECGMYITRQKTSPHQEEYST